MVKNRVSLFKMFMVFFKIGAFTIGGGLAMIPLIQNEFVVKQKWVEEKEIVDLLAISQSLPGVIAVNSSIYMGYRMAGVAGAVVSTVGIVLPSYIIILLISFLMTNFSEIWYVQKAFAGVRAGVTALITYSTYNLVRSSVKSITAVVIAVASFILLVFLNVDISIVILLAIAFGIGMMFFKEKIR